MCSPVSQPGGYEHASATLSSFAVDSDDVVRVLVEKDLNTVKKLHEGVKAWWIVVLDRDALDVAAEEIGVVAALCTQVEDQELLLVIMVEEPYNIIYRVAVCSFGAKGR